ncbi:RRQRL motif-containing zinc-binding protein [Kitasatospora sp. NPDC096147]|uniref:RRQRL motif-containing zinc-binding protein n=1 Tax=Kitasatospora sp. NPDC096147 TaxID=3364093 RepID=UPI00380CBD39
MTRRRPSPDAPSGDGVLPVHRWKCAPDGLCTRRQLRARGLSPGGQPVAAVIRWRSRFGGTAEAHLYRPELAQPVREMTPSRWAALTAANRARRTCPTCRRDAGYVLPRHLGTCVPCANPADIGP